MQCSFAKQNTGHGTNAAKKVAAAPVDTYRRSGKPPLQIIVLKTQLLAFRRPFLRKIASRCSTGSVPRRVERSGRRRPPCRSDRGRNPCSQADWRKSRAFPPIRTHFPCREAAFPHSACSCPAENRSVELCRPCVLSFFDFCFATLFPIIYNKGGFLTCPIRNTSGAVRQAVLQGLPGEYGCRAFLFVPPAYMLPGERLLRMLGVPAFSLRGGHVFLCAEQQQTPYRLCALRAGGRRRRACVVSGRQ